MWVSQKRHYEKQKMGQKWTAKNIHKYSRKENKIVTVKKNLCPLSFKRYIFNVIWKRVKHHNENIKIIYIILKSIYRTDQI